MTLYLIIKSLHIISIIGWMAAIMYFPRILINYFQQNKENQHTKECLYLMAKKLGNYIMTPLMLASWFFGIMLIVLNGSLLFQVWWQIKFLFAIMILFIHLYYIKLLQKNKKHDNNRNFIKKLKIMNEVPFLLMIIIVFLVILKPTLL